MAILDKLLQTAKAQASVRAAGTYYGTDCIDLGNSKGKNIIQERGTFQIRVGTAYAGGTSVEYQLVSSDTPWTDPAGTGATNVKVYASTGAIPVANLTANTIVAEIPIPLSIKGQYFGARAIGVGTFTAGDHDYNVAVGVQVS